VQRDIYESAAIHLVRERIDKRALLALEERRGRQRLSKDTSLDEG